MSDLKDLWPKDVRPKDVWPVEPLSESAKRRLIGEAIRGPQLQPWPQAIAEAVERALSEWRYGLAYKLAGATACITLGLGIGFNLEPHDHDIAGLALMTSTNASSAEMPE